MLIACCSDVSAYVFFAPQLKTDKAQEIKKLNQQIQMVQSDMSKHREALEDCLRSDKYVQAQHFVYFTSSMS